MTDLSEIITQDFEIMKDMLSEIELKILGVEEIKQTEFYQPIKRMIFEAWCDTCDKKDNFLFGNNNTQLDT